jgi:hypothetical protein
MKESADNQKEPITTKPTKATGASLKPLPSGCIEDNTPSQQLFIGGLPGKPPQKKPIPTKPTKATGALSLRPGPKGFVEVAGNSHIFVGGLPGRPPKK